MKANKLLDSQGLCVRRQHDINEHCGVVGDDAERRMFCKSCPPPTIRVNSDMAGPNLSSALPRAATTLCANRALLAMLFPRPLG